MVFKVFKNLDLESGTTLAEANSTGHTEKEHCLASDPGMSHWGAYFTYQSRPGQLLLPASLSPCPLQGKAGIHPLPGTLVRGLGHPSSSNSSQYKVAILAMPVFFTSLPLCPLGLLVSWLSPPQLSPPPSNMVQLRLMFTLDSQLSASGSALPHMDSNLSPQPHLGAAMSPFNFFYSFNYLASPIP